MGLKIKTKKVIDSFDFDKLVKETYGRTYCFQQQDGCQPRGNVHFSVPEESYDEEMHDDIPEVVNGSKMGVKFKTWLDRDPNKPLPGKSDDDTFSLRLFWQRNFYPDFGTLINDLHEKGLIEAGEYTMEIDW